MNTWKPKQSKVHNLIVYVNTYTAEQNRHHPEEPYEKSRLGLLDETSSILYFLSNGQFIPFVDKEECQRTYYELGAAPED